MRIILHLFIVFFLGPYQLMRSFVSILATYYVGSSRGLISFSLQGHNTESIEYEFQGKKRMERQKNRKIAHREKHRQEQ